MKRIVLSIVIVLFLSWFALFISKGTSGWWPLCDVCQTSWDFQRAALNAPYPHDVVYVTNPTNGQPACG